MADQATEDQNDPTAPAKAVGDPGALAGDPATPAPKADVTGDDNNPQGASRPSAAPATPMDTLAAYYAQNTPVTPKAPSASQAPQQSARSAVTPVQPIQASAKNAAMLMADDKPRRDAEAKTVMQAGAAADQAAEHPHAHGNAAHGWAAGPTGYTGFDQLFGDNAGTANRSADALESRVRGDITKAQGDEKKGYGDWQQGLADTVGRASVSGSWGDPANPENDYGGYSPSENLTNEFTQANGERNALGMGAGGVQALSDTAPGAGAQPMSRFGAGLTAAAGQPEFQRLQDQYKHLDSALSGDVSRSQDDLAASQAQAQANRVALNQAELAGQPPPPPPGAYAAEDADASLTDDALHFGDSGPSYGDNGNYDPSGTGRGSPTVGDTTGMKHVEGHEGPDGTWIAAHWE